MLFDFLIHKKKSEAELGQPIGEITHYFPHVKAGVIKLTKGMMSVGDTIYIKGSTTDFEQKVRSMQTDHVAVEKAKRGQEIGVKLRKKVRRGDSVYKI